MHPDTDIDRPPTGSRFLPWVLLGLVAAAAIVLLVVLPRRGAPPVGALTHAGVGQELTDVRFEPLINTDEPLAIEELRGKVVLVNYWGPWCPPCLVELPELLQLQAKFREQEDFRMVLVSSWGGHREGIEDLREDSLHILSQHKAELPIYHDESHQGIERIIEVARLNGFSLPTTIVLDRQGVIRGVWLGFHATSVKEMQDLVEQLLDAR
jgi:cytochrome c biogenesis protein CcmG, thiol:disulfide interchange protein DsbE